MYINIAYSGSVTGTHRPSCDFSTPPLYSENIFEQINFTIKCDAGPVASILSNCIIDLANWIPLPYWNYHDKDKISGKL